MACLLHRWVKNRTHSISMILHEYGVRMQWTTNVKYESTILLQVE